MQNTAAHITKPKSIAYFSMEYGLENDIKEYAGGLGILAGDTLKAAADMELNMVGVGILYKQGYFKQEFDVHGAQQEAADIWDYQKFLTNTGKRVQIQMADGAAFAEIWQYEITGVTGHKVPIYFLNTDIPENYSENRYISYNLYTNYQHTRLRQEIMLGIGGVYALQAMGHNNIDKYHLNESHAAFGILALQELLVDTDLVKQKVVFTTHTPAEHGHVKYPKAQLAQFLAPHYLDMLHQDFENEELHLTKFCLRHASYANGVAKRHGEISRHMFPEFDIDHVTNGIHVATWAGSATAQLYDAHIPNWRLSPEELRLAQNIPADEITQMHKQNKQELLQYIADKNQVELDPQVFTIGFGRRVDGYKRSGLIFHDMAALQNLAEKYGGIQIVISGKAYFDYKPAENVIAHILRHAQQDLGMLKIVYLANYDMTVSRLMTQGCDIWLNNPIKPLEASGTSGMKAALNGVPNFSTIDGWWVEGWEEGLTGWSIGQPDITESEDAAEAMDIYRKLDESILPMFYNADKTAWVNIQLAAISRNASYFNTHRMLTEYVHKAYNYND